jgi:hypothetical protein
MTISVVSTGAPLEYLGVNSTRALVETTDSGRRRLTATQTTLVSRFATLQGNAGTIHASRRSRLPGSLPASLWSDVMSSTTGSRPTSSDLLHGLKKSWQRGLALEYVLVASFVAFTIVQFLFVIGIKSS